MSVAASHRLSRRSDIIDVTEACRQCRGPRLVRVVGHCSDVCSIDLAGKHTYGCGPRDLVIGGGDAIHFRYCLDCGQIQGNFPVPSTPSEQDRE